MAGVWSLFVVTFLAVASALPSVDPKCKNPNAKAMIPDATAFIEPQAKLAQVWCDDCNEGVQKMVDHCIDPANDEDLSTFCTGNMQTLSEECAFMTTQIEKIFCPQSPCQKLQFSQSKTPGAVCDHGLINCSPRPIIKPTEEVEVVVTEVSCGVCNAILEKMLKWCKETSEYMDEPEPGFCKQDMADDIPTCKYMVKTIGGMFAPQSICDGIKCHTGNLGKVCSKPPISCGGGSEDAKKGPPVHMFDDYILHLNNSDAQTVVVSKAV